MLEHEIGVVCGACDAYTPMGQNVCVGCGREVRLHAPGSAAQLEPSSEPPGEVPGTSAVTNGDPLMEQARHYVCTQCATLVPSGHKFCGNCGAQVPLMVQKLQTNYFGPMQTPGRGRLLVIRGQEGSDGINYVLNTDAYVIGRTTGEILFPMDSWVSPQHAKLFYDASGLSITDLGSVNGVYVRIREPVTLQLGDAFICGEQVFRLEAPPKDSTHTTPDMTYFYASPKRPSAFRIIQVLEGGREGIVFCARGNQVRIGREDNDLNFSEDVFMSGNHATLQMVAEGRFSLTDNNSKNGTYMRIREKQALRHDDYLFIGHHLLRVELTA
ncbi:MAG: FHA domain-containing protein [Myxococcales bacterium]|nr:FHA domain-containing protein [Myxococcales bacterium]